MDNEEKKTAPAPSVPEEESEFSDALKIEEPEEKPEEAVEEKEEPKEKEAPAPKEEKKKEEPVVYTYDDPNLANIEAARAAFLKSYKGMGKWTFIPTLLLIAGIVLAWLIPGVIMPNDTSGLALGLSLGIVGVLLIVMLVLSFLKRKKTNAMMKDYFGKFYTYTDEYVFHGTGVTNLEGNIDSKLSKEEFDECDLYKDVFSVGSRASLVFKYGGKKCGIADAAAQIRGQKAALTVFVGKFFRAPNAYKGDPLVIYLKGNDRALPPTNIDGLPIIHEDKEMVVRGSNLAKKYFTKRLRDAVKAIRTDDTLVDVTIKIEEGRTFVLLGYEDTLMVLPMEKPFNPYPTEHYRADMKKVFALVDAIDGLKGPRKTLEEAEAEIMEESKEEPEAKPEEKPEEKPELPKA